MPEQQQHHISQEVVQYSSSPSSHSGGSSIATSLDELAKGLASGTLSRGKAIRLVGGALLGAALGSFPGVAWADDCRRLGRECRRDSQCCSKNCVRQESLWPQVRKPQEKRESLWRVLQPLCSGTGVRGWCVRRRSVPRRITYPSRWWRPDLYLFGVLCSVMRRLSIRNNLYNWTV